MKTYLQITLILTLAFSLLAFGQDYPSVGFEELLSVAEEDVNILRDARLLTAQQDIPHTIYLPEGIFIEAKGIEDGKVVYAVITNIVDIYDGGYTAFWENIISQYDLLTARQHFTNSETINPAVGYPSYYEEEKLTRELAPTFLMIPESTNDRVMSFNVTNGDLLNTNFIPMDPTNLSTPIDAILTPGITIFVSDQLDDHIVGYDTLGSFLGIFAGGIPDTLDNIRGIKLDPDLNSLLVTVASGGNSDAIARFDPGGNYVGNFITPNATVMDSPWEIVFRTSDVLISAGTTDNIARYDLSGTYLDNFVSGIDFPEQIRELTNGNVIAAGFSGSSGLYIYDSNGTQLNYFAAVSGLRGCYQLLNGNYLVTNGSGVHEINGSTGALVRTVISGVSARFVEPFDIAAVPVELTSFKANVVNGIIVLNWSTSTETNNSGFEILRSTQNDKNWRTLGFVPGFGTTTEPKSYSYSDETVTSGTYSYKLKQIDYDGSYSFSDIVEVEISLPTEFALEQNYPNPFNPSTSIQFSLPVDANVEIGVYNLVGEMVAEVVNGDFSAGKHNVSFEASNLTSGVYFYRIDATASNGNNFSNVKKMTLIK
ncbi:MAG: T9SS type A sorting domain-containing protein [Ignavibacteria bacterium]|nr:T9SS type A sorting domain-containing protein [Ignavibacteria bacterium]MBT8383315.1 T9SS type A sorting domain-containing protein [Ignavibacteria bacterium]NNJ52435.1 T9SS type A sorting domain-containing protein [Ignavibacteriaceae bacterium]NNL22552.1 T9SS type A sorting domain-containing protein [Ignavibacteriaceae bacterium]